MTPTIIFFLVAGGFLSFAGVVVGYIYVFIVHGTNPTIVPLVTATSIIGWLLLMSVLFYTIIGPN
jgi:hypothetical protein